MTGPADAHSAIDAFREAAELNLEDPIRQGSLLVFGSYGQLVATGDFHGHRRNFAKLVKYCALERSPGRCVILQELIHEELHHADQLDMSHELLLEAARWKIAFPDQVFFLQSNHEVSQLTGRGIMKGGHEVLEGFVAGIEATYGAAEAEGVMEAIAVFIESYPLAARTSHRLFLSHSLPARRDMEVFDPSVLNSRVTLDDLADGPAGAFLWGRRHETDLLDQLAELLDADVFICGHQPEPEGFRQANERMLILSSDHSHGVFLPIDLTTSMAMSDLIKRIRKFVSVA